MNHQQQYGPDEPDRVPPVTVRMVVRLGRVEWIIENPHCGIE